MCFKGMEQLELSYSAGGDVNGKQFDNFLKL